MLGFHLVATALLAVAVFGTGDDLSDVSRSDLGWFVFVGALGWLSYLAFYRALAIGPISIVSPIVSAYAAVTVICAVLIGGESLAGEALAVAVVLLGVLLASSDLRQIRAIERLAAVGLVLALLTAVLIGAFVYGVAASPTSTAGSYRSSWRGRSRRSSSSAPRSREDNGACRLDLGRSS